MQTKPTYPLTNGFYRSAPIPWEDWHAGLYAKGEQFNYLQLTTDGQYYRLMRNEENFDLSRFLKSMKQEETQGVEHGHYSIEGGKLRFDLYVSSLDTSVTYYWAIITPDFLLMKTVWK